MAYIKAMYFLPEDTEEKVIEDIISLETKGKLAEKYQHKRHSAYKRFLRQEREAREARALALYGQSTIGPDFTYGQLYSVLQIRQNFDEAVKYILSNRVISSGRAALQNNDEVVCWYKNSKKYTLEMLEELLGATMVKELVVSTAPVIRERLEDALKVWVAAEVNGILVSRFGASNEELQRLDSDRVAALFLTSKYHMAHKGVYPTPKLKLEARPEEVYQYFYRNKHRYMQLHYFTWQAFCIEDKADLSSVLNSFKDGVSFKTLARKYGFRKYLHLSAKRKVNMNTVGQAKSGLDLEKRLQAVAISIARENNQEPYRHDVDGALFLLLVTDIHYENEDIDFKAYRETVLLHMTEDIFREQFHSDMNLTKKALNFRVTR